MAIVDRPSEGVPEMWQAGAGDIWTCLAGECYWAARADGGAQIFAALRRRGVHDDDDCEGGRGGRDTAKYNVSPERARVRLSFL